MKVLTTEPRLLFKAVIKLTTAIQLSIDSDFTEVRLYEVNKA